MSDSIRGVGTSDPVTPAATTGQTAVTTSTDAASAPVSAGSGTDLADVTQTESLLQSIIQAANNTPGIDKAKVADLQQAVTSGAYQANPQSIAQKLVELENLLGTAGQVR
jgi:negative regulator of flagellin synthesis FlgM